jgi:hypothetical protein
MKHLVELLVGLVAAALAIRFAADLISPALPLLVGVCGLGLVARWLFIRRDRW